MADLVGMWSHGIAAFLSLALSQALGCGTPPAPPDAGATDASADANLDAGPDADQDAGLPATPPNIVLIVSDDQGWNDVGVHNPSIDTPHLDQLAAEGVRLDNFYVQPVCSPTRVGLLTGRYPIHWGLMRSVIRPWNEGAGLNTLETTSLPEVLAGAGYTARGAIGKWHLGRTSRALHHPLSHGFTSYYGNYLGAVDYCTHERFGERDWHRDDASSTDTGYVTDLIGDEASTFIEEHATERFFLYVAFTAPHTPLQRRADCPTGQAGSDRAKFVTMVEEMDENVGKILGALEQQGLADNTLVWFLSDNGGNDRGAGSNTPLRGGKSTVFEGGIRSFSAVRLPGSIAAGSTTTVPTAYIDVLPTLAALARATPPAELDGRNQWRALQGHAADSGRTLYFYNEQFVQGSGVHEEQTAALDWPLKLVRVRDLNNGSVTSELYNIEDDSSEATPVTNAEVETALTQQVQTFLALNPGHVVDPTETLPGDFIAPSDWEMQP